MDGELPFLNCKASYNKDVESSKIVNVTQSVKLEAFITEVQDTSFFFFPLSKVHHCTTLNLKHAQLNIMKVYPQLSGVGNVDTPSIFFTIIPDFKTTRLF